MIRKLVASAAVTAHVLAFAGAALAVEIETTASVFSLTDQTDVDGGTATISRFNNGVAITLDTNGLQPGDAVTVWAQVFNSPQNCSEGGCGPGDIFIFGDGKRTANQAGREAARISGREARSRQPSRTKRSSRSHPDSR